MKERLLEAGCSVDVQHGCAGAHGGRFKAACNPGKTMHIQARPWWARP